MKHRKSIINYRPIGTIAIISPRNYPFFIAFAQNCTALITGNSVIFKPSESASLVGLKIQDLFDNSGIPKDLIQTIIGDEELGSELVENKPDKIFFTGSTCTGKKIMLIAAKSLTPVNLELGGKDPMIILQDANIDFGTSAALWGSFMNSGQACASIKRLIIHESIANQFIESLKQKISHLRHGNSCGTDFEIGPLVNEKQKETFTRQILEAKKNGATIITGGEFSKDGRYYLPALVSGSNIEDLELFQEETIGPIVTFSTFRTIEEAIQKANNSHYGLAASIITRNTTLGEQLARRQEVGSIYP